MESLKTTTQAADKQSAQLADLASKVAVLTAAASTTPYNYEEVAQAPIGNSGGTARNAERSARSSYARPMTEPSRQQTNDFRSDRNFRQHKPTPQNQQRDNYARRQTYGQQQNSTTYSKQYSSPQGQSSRSYGGPQQRDYVNQQQGPVSRQQNFNSQQSRERVFGQSTQDGQPCGNRGYRHL